MKKEIKIVNPDLSITAMTVFNLKAIIDGLVLGHPNMEFSIALSDKKIVPLQSALATDDKNHMILADPAVAKKLVKQGKARMVFKAMSNEEKVNKIGR